MKLFTTRQIADIDQYTIIHEPIADVDLMERAAMQMTKWIVRNISPDKRLLFFAGPGNNGGDALAMARQLSNYEYCCEVYLLPAPSVLRNAPAINWKRLQEQGKVKCAYLNDSDDFPKITDDDVLIDGLFGSGLSRPLSGLAAELVQYLNQFPNLVIAVDIPSGLMGEDNAPNQQQPIVRADVTLTLQFPKISFFFSENSEYVGEWEVLPIGLHPDAIESMASSYVYVQKQEVAPCFDVRPRFAHKGNFGHALLIAGSQGKMGAAVLASKACLRAGVGLLTAHVPQCGYPILQTAVPEAMVDLDQHDMFFTNYPALSRFSAIGIGPGLDQKRNTVRAFLSLLESFGKPLVLDADALNILSENREALQKLPEGSILTPHPGEFRRLVGDFSSDYEALQKQIEFAQTTRCVVVVKGAYTRIVSPEGKVYFNSTGNPGMATAGSGDVLTGIVLGLLAQGFDPVDAAVAGVFVHGLAGDLAAAKKSEYALVAGDLVRYLGKAIRSLTSFD